VYATTWTAAVERLRTTKSAELDVEIALDAMQQAWSAVLALREAVPRRKFVDEAQDAMCSMLGYPTRKS